MNDAEALAEAVQARKQASNGTEFSRALARERVLRRRMAEAKPWDEALHPRGRGGAWVKKLGALKEGQSLKIGGVTVTKTRVNKGTMIETVTHRVSGGGLADSHYIDAKDAASEVADRLSPGRSAEPLSFRPANAIASPPQPGTPARAEWAAKHGEAPTHMAYYSHPTFGSTTRPIHGATDKNAWQFAKQLGDPAATLQGVERVSRPPTMSKDFQAISFSGTKPIVGRFPSGKPNPYEFGS